MSRSYKKTPILKDRNKDMKNFANRKVRKSVKNLPDGNTYKKAFPSYDISDWEFRTPKALFKAEVEEAFQRARMKEKNYLMPIERLKEPESIDFDKITLHELSDRIDYNHWRKNYYNK